MNINFPSTENKSTRESILFMLGRKWPLNAKEIHNVLKREFGLQVTYQAVHKVLHQMNEEKTLEKKDNGYQINGEWIKKIKDFSTSLEHDYADGKKVDYENSESMHLVFENLIDFAKFMINDFYINFPNKKNKDCLCLWKHVYPLTGLGEKEHLNMKRMLFKQNHYGLTKGNTAIDNLFSDYLKKLGKKNICGVSYPVNNDTFVMGDHICEAIIEPTQCKKIDETYEKIKSTQNLDLNKLFELATEKNEVHALITKNASFADWLRKEAKKKACRQNLNPRHAE